MEAPDGDDGDCVAALCYINQQRPSALTREERLDILRLHVHLRRAKAPRVAETIAAMLGRSDKTDKQVWAEFKATGSVYVAIQPANRGSRPSVVPNTSEVTTAVKEFVRLRRITRTRTVAKDVMAFLDEHGYIAVDRGCDRSMNTWLRAVQRYLGRRGYKRGKKPGASLRLSSKHAVACATYVQAISRRLAATTDKVVMVYLDESYIHHHYKLSEDSLYHPDDADEQEKEKHKGRRFCFIAAIVDLGEEASKAIAVDIFQGGKKETKDYHGMFTQEYFDAWFQGLLDELEGMGITKACIVLDNAKYHKGLPEGTPRRSWPKADLQLACLEYSIPVDAFDLKPLLCDRLDSYIKQNIKPVVVSMAEARGHEVFFTPPHHSNLQPIEMYWANIKTRVGRAYTTGTTFQDVRTRLEEAFETIGAYAIYGCIRDAEMELEKLHSQLQEADMAECSGGGSSDDESSADSESDVDTDAEL
ncbi:hypothetical protein ACHHYP_11247 [Achlya hypogyna]|uniref:Tc1-like transposase DDE domain-containing protein n=1 Tax=Achlya hypogyna TaxID=1202772 RepID=A0A1V9YJI1_ACHHY|nr:hypothetical protein ACHHYP_11247 [Achlya hypogyna]